MALAKTSASRNGKTGRRIAGFTLVEILIALVVVGVAAALVVPKFLAKPDPAKIETARQEVSTIRDALSSYKTDNNMYPTVNQGLAALSKKPTQAPVPPAWQDTGYLDNLPTDPWGNPYQYKNPGEHGDVDVFSLGADGKPGGDGPDADIGSWM